MHFKRVKVEEIYNWSIESYKFDKVFAPLMVLVQSVTMLMLTLCNHINTICSLLALSDIKVIFGLI